MLDFIDYLDQLHTLAGNIYGILTHHKKDLRVSQSKMRILLEAKFQLEDALYDLFACSEVISIKDLKEGQLKAPSLEKIQKFKKIFEGLKSWLEVVANSDFR